MVHGVGAHSVKMTKFNVQNVANPGLCVDCGYKHHGERFGLKECGWGGEQEMHLTWHQDIRPGRRSVCWDVSSGDPQAPVLLYNCHGMGGNQLWKYDPVSASFVLKIRKIEF
ncbi:putative polypeptide N-acetylgalactosaminyltransferase 10 [Portunus trituberculatus]|uniref:Putative polypeptide N-acetylgalactosaminyltransferase 10 n=1 Tax=Portunus trituberculatus TaxID=210409 RepID=A0A5B7IEE5_PORTR|nr:putative polypeptide N-acetylgalactosaminyltransferase 10 [Portunus trituberculatus]